MNNAANANDISPHMKHSSCWE